MSKPLLVFLIGPRASGKTSLGRPLAARLAGEFLDLDAMAVEKAGCTIADLVACKGWEAFRHLESQLLQGLCRRGLTGSLERPLVAATGGGAVLDAANRALMRRHGRVLWLDAPVPVLEARLRADLAPDQRPSLTGDDPVAEAGRIAREREPLYRECAHHRLDASLPLAALLDQADLVLQSPVTQEQAP